MTQKPTQGLSPEHAEWLEEKRGLSAELCARFGLVSRGDQLGFPYRLNDAVRFAKWRHLDKSGMRISPPGVPLSLYNLDGLSEVQGLGNTLVITEGELDCIAVAHTGNYAVSVPHGAPAKVGEGDIVQPRIAGSNTFGSMASCIRASTSFSASFCLVTTTGRDAISTLN